LGLISRLCTETGEVSDGVGEEIGETSGDVIGEVIDAMGVGMSDVAGEVVGCVTGEEVGDGVIKTKLLNAPDKKTIANKLAMMAPAMIAVLVEFFLFLLSILGIGLTIVWEPIWAGSLVSFGLESGGLCFLDLI
jgi:hypothetical protein